MVEVKERGIQRGKGRDRERQSERVEKREREKKKIERMREKYDGARLWGDSSVPSTSV